MSYRSNLSGSIIIGVLMFPEVRRIELTTWPYAAPAVLTIFSFMPLTSISDGMAIGLIAYVHNDNARAIRGTHWLSVLLPTLITYYAIQ